MKKWFFGILLVFAALVSCSKPENGDELSLKTNVPIEAIAVNTKDLAASIPADIKGISDTCHSRTFTLLAGKTINVGNVVVANDLNFLYITYNTTGDWDLSEVHLYVLNYEPEERLTPGQAPFTSGSLPDGTNTYTFTLPLSETLLCGSSIWLQAHAAVNTETAYGGTIVDPDQGAWYGNISYTIECCEPPETECKLSASADATDVKCYADNSGAINVTVTGGTAPFSYLWNTGAISEDLIDITAGTYSLTIYDAKQCTFELKDIIVKEISGIEITSKITPVSCEGNDGAIDIIVTGGTAPYTYSWNPDGEITEDLSGLSKGDYNVTIYDANRCMAYAKFTVTEDCDKPEGIIAFARKTYEPMVHCFLDLDMDNNGTKDFTDWGWTNGAMYPNETFLSTYELWINVKDCDITRATKVGEIKLHYSAGTATATFTLIDDYTMSESRLYIGNDMLPKIEGAYTVDPANYPYKHLGLGAAVTDSYTVNGLSDDIYIIGYVLINPAYPEVN